MSHNDLSNPANLSRVLSMLVTNDTKTIRAAEKQLKVFMKKPASVTSMLNQIHSNPLAEVRHQAALMLKKKMCQHYSKIGAANQQVVRTQIFALLKNESNRSIAVAIAGCISTLAKGVFSVGSHWPELFANLSELGQSTNETYRYLAYSLLEQVRVELLVFIIVWLVDWLFC